MPNTKPPRSAGASTPPRSAEDSQSPPGQGSDPSLKHSSSTLSRLTRSVSKLRSHRRRPSDVPAAEAVAAAMATAPSAPAALGRLASLRTELPPRGPPLAATTTTTAAAVDAAAFLRVVPDMLSVDAVVATSQAALRAAEGLARTLRSSAVEERATATASAVAAPASPAGVEAAQKASADRGRWERCLCDLEVAVAEHRFEEAVAHWRKLRAEAGRAPQDSPAAVETAWRMSLEAERWGVRLGEAVRRRMDLDGRSHCPVDGMAPLVKALAQCAGPAAALDALLASASVQLREDLDEAAQEAPEVGVAGDSAAVELASSIGQAFCLGAARAWTAAHAALNTRELATCGGSLTEWTMGELHGACEVLRKAAILPRAAPAGLSTTARCAAAFVVHCDALAANAGCPVGQFAREAVWPSVSPVLERRVRQLCEGMRKGTKAEAAAASRLIALPPPDESSWDALFDVFPSYKRLLAEFSMYAATLALIASPQAVAACRLAIATIFSTHGEALATALSANPNASAAAELAMEVATRLMERGLAEATDTLTAAGWGSSLDAVALLAAVERMAQTMGMASVPLEEAGEELEIQ